MSGTFTNLKYHFIWSTEGRYPFIKDPIQDDLYAYIADIINSMDGIPDVINGTKDHLHILLGLHQDVPVSEATREIKANSSHWMKDNSSGINTKFQWQSGYAAFTVSHSKLDEVHHYIKMQEDHHRELTFRKEYKKFLQRNEIDFDEEYMF